MTAESKSVLLKPEEAADEPKVNSGESSIPEKIHISDFIKNNDLTAKKDIKWHKGLTYISPVIT